MRPVEVIASGMMTAVGFDTPSTAAAVRCGISGASETRFRDRGGEWILGCPVPLPESSTGLTRLRSLLSPPVGECLRSAVGLKAAQIPLILLLAERDRPGRMEDLEAELQGGLEADLRVQFDSRSKVLAEGRVGLVTALREAERLLHGERAPACIIAGVDSMLIQSTLAALELKDRLLTSVQSNGFIPGEAGSAVLVSAPARGGHPALICRGTGLGNEKATVESEEPLRAQGLVEAIRGALKDASATFDDVDYRLTDLSGEQYGFKEAVLAIGRAMRKVKADFPIWHPADCIGETGAAAGPCLLGLALEAGRKNYAPGPGVLCQLASDDGRRGAALLTYGAGTP